MKQIFKLIVAIMIMAIAIDAHAAKNEDVTLIVTSDGTTKDEAIKNALRSAIEQTYGVFVSANTDILNDEVVSDEIATVASGNIKSYKELSVSQSEAGTTVTLEAVVSVGKLISYAKSKGAEVEFDGASMLADIQLQELYKENEEKAVRNIINKTLSLLNDGFDYEIFVGERKGCDIGRNGNPSGQGVPNTIDYNDNQVIVPYTVFGRLNSSGEQAIQELFKTLAVLSGTGPTLNEIESYLNGAEKISNKRYDYISQQDKEIRKLQKKYPKVTNVFPDDYFINTGQVNPKYMKQNLNFVIAMPGAPKESDGSPSIHLNYWMKSPNSVNMLNDFFNNQFNEILCSYVIVGDNGIIRSHSGKGVCVLYTAARGAWYEEVPQFKSGILLYWNEDKITSTKDEIKSIKKIRVEHNPIIISLPY